MSELFYLSSKKRVYSEKKKKKKKKKKKEILPIGRKMFPFRVDPFLEGDWCAGKQKGSHKSCL